MNDYKTCHRCRQLLPIDSFYKSKKAKSGLASSCKRCQYEMQKASMAKKPEHYKAKRKEWQVDNREHLNELARKYYWENPEAFRIRSKVWASQHKDEIAVKNYLYKSANAEYLNQLTKQWRAANPEKVIEQNNRRRQRMSNNGMFFIRPKEIRRLLSQPCFYCGAPSEHLDHVVPIKRGGVHSIGNLLPACAPCNQSKSDKLLTEWRRDLRKRLGATGRVR